MKSKMIKNYEEVYEHWLSYIKSMDDENLEQTLKTFKNGLDEISETNRYDSTAFHTRLHEIRCHKFYNLFGQVETANDDKLGLDFKLNNIVIECVSPGYGDIGNPDYKLLSKMQFGVYDVPVDAMLRRITNSITSKIKQYHKNLEKGQICDKTPFIIDLGLTTLGFNFQFGYEFRDLLKILIDCGFQIIYFDKETMKYSHSDFQRGNVIKNPKSGATIPINYFIDENYNFISAIIVHDEGYMKKDYGIDNTVVFLNPYAKNQIDLNIFHGYKVWNYSLSEDGESGEYKLSICE